MKEFTKINFKKSILSVPYFFTVFVVIIISTYIIYDQLCERTNIAMIYKDYILEDINIFFYIPLFLIVILKFNNSFDKDEVIIRSKNINSWWMNKLYGNLLISTVYAITISIGISFIVCFFYGFKYYIWFLITLYNYSIIYQIVGYMIISTIYIILDVFFRKPIYSYLTIITFIFTLKNINSQISIVQFNIRKIWEKMYFTEDIIEHIQISNNSIFVAIQDFMFLLAIVLVGLYLCNQKSFCGVKK